MTKHSVEAARITRRYALLQGVGIATGAAALFAPRRAEAKMAQTAAAYQDPAASSDKVCSGCSLFQPPKSCQLVDGDVSPTGGCKFWVKKPS